MSHVHLRITHNFLLFLQTFQSDFNHLHISISVSTPGKLLEDFCLNSLSQDWV